MIKNFFLVILGIFLLAVALIMGHLPSRHFAYQLYHGTKLFIEVETAYQNEPLCKTEEKIKACIKKIVTDSGGYKFGTDIGIIMSMLMNKNLAYDTSVRANTALVEMINPNDFWISGVKGKAAKKILAREKNQLIKSLTDNRVFLQKVIKENRYPASLEDQNAWVTAIDAKIYELEK